MTISRAVHRALVKVGAGTDRQNRMNGLALLRALPSDSIPLVVFDPQYRNLMEKMRYGNEGARQKERAKLPQMDWSLVLDFLSEIERVLRPSGHVLWWVDKHALVEGKAGGGVGLLPVDMLTWEKRRIGMGYRTRRKSEYVVVKQKLPIRAKGVWRDHAIPDVWTDALEQKAMKIRDHVVYIDLKKKHPHAKPEGLLRRLIEATTRTGDIVLDPTAGGYSTMRAARFCRRTFVGCDIRKWSQGI